MKWLAVYWVFLSLGSVYLECFDSGSGSGDNATGSIDHCSDNSTDNGTIELTNITSTTSVIPIASVNITSTTSLIPITSVISTTSVIPTVCWCVSGDNNPIVSLAPTVTVTQTINVTFLVIPTPPSTNSTFPLPLEATIVTGAGSGVVLALLIVILVIIIILCLSKRSKKKKVTIFPSDKALESIRLKDALSLQSYDQTDELADW